MATKHRLHCSVITPEQQVADVDCDAVVLPAHDGLVGVLPGRAPLLCEVGIGALRLSAAGEPDRLFFVDGGFAQVLRDQVTLLTSRALPAADVSRSAAAAALSEARAMRIADEATLEARRKAVERAAAQLKLAGRE